MHSAKDRRDNAEWIEAIEEAATDLGLDDETGSVAVDLFLSTVPDADRSKPAAVAASVYAATLIAGEGRTQTAVADAVGVSRISVQQRWRERLESAGMEPPSW
ncbi:transcription factor TFIIB cyclin-like protein [Salinarchaeum sp. Harcht-Bsk1]|uniref:transcription factor TFIIB cyclin-like protein n=1 Tax=Salinarchaeum sp. Harcht-Bsk1 TaxID=1333523 RepID=UPI0003422BFE|nr:transcription factor TFIIB cyclin-like protein [Salinarchaeum sp. Harcht-Bsk1]AGN01978.1 transcription factor TFIIB cyclin-like protein [Salinarchaeum sp. Harcht-Bsk1]